jgi:hypothetical protein
VGIQYLLPALQRTPPPGGGDRESSQGVLGTCDTLKLLGRPVIILLYNPQA